MLYCLFGVSMPGSITGRKRTPNPICLGTTGDIFTLEQMRRGEKLAEQFVRETEDARDAMLAAQHQQPAYFNDGHRRYTRPR
jgi:hypothetical protein